MERDKATLLDIARAARFVQEFIADTPKEAFLIDFKTQSAVLHQLMVIGEAAKRLSIGFRDEHPSIPWSLIAGMRDKLIHGYDIVDLDEVWRTAKVDVPGLREAIKPLLPQQE